MNLWKVLTIILLFAVLAGIRFFEDELFYDPLLRFFDGDFKLKPPPIFDEWKLILSTGLRYLLNTLVSLLILYVAFGDLKTIKFSVLIYLLAFVLLTSGFIWLIFNISRENYFTLFYVRRFLIQPLFVLLLLPAFYYQKSL